MQTFQNDLQSLRALLRQETPKTSRLKRAFLRMLYSSAITALETYLSDAFYQSVIKDESLVERLMLTTPEFAEKRYSLSEVVEWKKQTKEKVSDYLFNIVWHNLAKVRCMYREVLGVNFPDDSSAIFIAVGIRHDIVHRGVKTKTGKTHNLREADVQKLFQTIGNVVSKIDAQLKARSLKK